MLLPVRLVLQSIPYKYVVWSTIEKKEEWEYLEFVDDYNGAIVDRSLFLPSSYARKGGKLILFS